MWIPKDNSKQSLSSALDSPVVNRVIEEASVKLSEWSEKLLKAGVGGNLKKSDYGSMHLMASRLYNLAAYRVTETFNQRICDMWGGAEVRQALVAVRSDGGVRVSDSLCENQRGFLKQVPESLRRSLHLQWANLFPMENCVRVMNNLAPVVLLSYEMMLSHAKPSTLYYLLKSLKDSEFSTQVSFNVLLGAKRHGYESSLCSFYRVRREYLWTIPYVPGSGRYEVSADSVPWSRNHLRGLYQDLQEVTQYILKVVATTLRMYLQSCTVQISANQLSGIISSIAFDLIKMVDRDIGYYAPPVEEVVSNSVRGALGNHNYPVTGVDLEPFREGLMALTPVFAEAKGYTKRTWWLCLKERCTDLTPFIRGVLIDPVEPYTSTYVLKDLTQEGSNPINRGKLSFLADIIEEGDVELVQSFYTSSRLLNLRGETYLNKYLVGGLIKDPFFKENLSNVLANERYISTVHLLKALSGCDKAIEHRLDTSPLPAVQEEVEESLSMYLRYHKGSGEVSSFLNMYMNEVVADRLGFATGRLAITHLTRKTPDWMEGAFYSFSKILNPDKVLSDVLNLVKCMTRIQRTNLIFQHIVSPGGK